MLIELIVVIALIAVLAFAMFPLINTTYESWRVADRRVELLQVGRLGMTKMGGETRKAYDMIACTSTTAFDYYPDWASSTAYRFKYNAATDYSFKFGTQTPFADNYLAGPLNSFSYLVYNRRMQTGVTRGRQANSFLFAFAVSDERHILPSIPGTLNPMSFRTFVQMRTSREGYKIAHSNTFSTETYFYQQSGAGTKICFKAFCDRINPLSMSVKKVDITCFTCGGGGIPSVPLTYTANGDYFQACTSTAILNVKAKAAAPTHRITITLQDSNSEKCSMSDGLYVVP